MLFWDQKETVVFEFKNWANSIQNILKLLTFFFFNTHWFPDLDIGSDIYKKIRQRKYIHRLLPENNNFLYILLKTGPKSAKVKVAYLEA